MGLNLGAIAKKSKLSDFYVDPKKEDVFVSTGVVKFDLALSGRARGGIPKGKIFHIAAPSKSGKTFIGMSAAKNAQEMGMSVLIIDTERAFSTDMAQSLGIDVSEEKLFICQSNSINEIQNFIVQFMNEIPKGEREDLLIIFDSWGSLVTTRSINNALDGKDVKDMSLPVAKNELANILLWTGATCYVINHVYEATGVSFGDPLKISGGSKLILNSQAIIKGRSKAKVTDKDKDITGFVITAIVEKSRYAKEGMKFEFKINFDGGLDKYYGLLEDALEGGFVDIGKVGHSTAYSRNHIENDVLTKEANLYSGDFWEPLLAAGFTEYLEKKYRYNRDFFKETESTD